MFSPSPSCDMATTASADFCTTIAAPLDAPSPTAAVQTSRGKTHDFRSIHPPHLRQPSPGDFGLQVVWPPRPPSRRLVYGSCSSGQSFAYSFLPTYPREYAVAVQLGVPVTKAPRGLPPPSHAPCPAHQRKGRAKRPGLADPCTALQAICRPPARPSNRSPPSRKANEGGALSD